MNASKEMAAGMRPRDGQKSMLFDGAMYSVTRPVVQLAIAVTNRMDGDARHDSDTDR